MYICIYVCEMYVCMYVWEKTWGFVHVHVFFFPSSIGFFIWGMRDGGFDGEGGREVGTLKSRGIHTYIHTWQRLYAV